MPVRSHNDIPPRLEALELRVDELEVALGSGGSFNILTLTNTVGQVEWGDTVSSVTLNWTLTEDSDNQTFNQGIGVVSPVTLRTYNYNTAFDMSGGDKTFTLTATKGVYVKNANTTVSFLPRIYWGTSVDGTIGSSAFQHSDLIGFDSILSSNRSRTVEFDCSGGKYFYYIYPDSLGAATFKINSLPFTGFNSPIPVNDFVNQYAYLSQYRVYRSEYIQYGSSIFLEVI